MLQEEMAGKLAVPAEEKDIKENVYGMQWERLLLETVFVKYYRCQRLYLWSKQVKIPVAIKLIMPKRKILQGL